MTHYVMKCFFREGDAGHKEKAIKASSDAQAISEATMIASLKHPTWFEVCVRTGNGDRVIYKSTPEPPL
ncbi:hypothetical protein PMI01_02604 [Caulobacter sp. AP07]|uniref:hypothetical protein n=1 Tax=Caulobacter sp. AP07 TaxID=1144304 RepID=UPI00027206D4|nr:hypothetical protein [Caulobacter sp. AP07]EJL32224.1 hypothetical protein PMI01_02604 [Caulobacter sp. AP07]